MKSSVLKFSFIALSSAITVFGCGKYFEAKKSSSPRPDVKSSQIVVKFHTGTSETERQGVLKSYQKVEVIDQENAVYLIHDESLKGAEIETSKSLSTNSAVEFAEPNFMVKINAEDQVMDLPADPYFLRLWGLKNLGQDAPNGIEGQEGADIGVMEAWKSTRGNRKVIVAIIDTGIDYAHPDLAANVWINEKEKNGIPGKDDDENGYTDDLHGWDSISDGRTSLHYGKVGDPDPMDDNGHGTHVAGTIGAVGGNGIGVVGINWDVQIAAVKFLDARGSGTSVDEYRALQYITANDFDVVNGSYGGNEKSQLVLSQLKAAKEKGILFVFAAGNSSANNDVKPAYPANYDVDNIISVAATDSRDQIADFSNFGQENVDIAAPGVNILSTVPTAKVGPEQPPYAVFSGTSMASPHVAGAAALLIASDMSLKKKPALIRKRLMETAEVKPHLLALVGSGGRLNINRAIKNSVEGNPLLGGQWSETPYSLETPAFPQQRIDNSWEIKMEGARAIRIHIRKSQVEDQFDVAMLYDSQYRPIMNLTGEYADFWSPVILGDTVYLKFSNAVVSVDGSAPFANFNSEGVQIDKVMVLK